MLGSSATLSGSAATKIIELPVGTHPKALESPHFPDRLHAFVWRNWQLIEPKRLAKVVDTTTDRIVAVARSMGLPDAGEILPNLRSRAYITIVRRNWHLIPYDQLVMLLDRSQEEFAFLLREDDGLFLKLGNLKPACPPLRYAEPDAGARKRAAEIKAFVQLQFADQLATNGEPRFHFIEQLARTEAGPNQRRPPTDFLRQPLCLIYSYFGGYGDPLGDAAEDPYPDGLLERLQAHGVNGVWLHVVLRQLAPGGKCFPEFGAGSSQRLAKLQQLCRRAKSYGIGIYLYVNEPRAMPAAFFEGRPEMAGVREGDYLAICTSDARVRNWLSDSLAHIFQQVPELAGVFTITASENLTNCACRFHHDDCPRCRNRSPTEIVAEVNTAIEEGVHRGNTNARVIVWDWGWNHHGDSSQEIAALPRNIAIMSASEWKVPISRGGVTHEIGEYSLSTPGPGPRATLHWRLAKQRGLGTVAKVQLNNSWELSSVPFLPVLDLVAEHCENLASAQVEGLMLGWTLGGYPSPNLQVAQRFAVEPTANKESVLDTTAVERYGSAAAPHVRQAWYAFSEALREYPFDLDVLYYAPQQMGPANLLYGEPTDFAATMIGIPYDDLERWRGPYPAEVLAEQFEKIAGKWVTGLSHFDQAIAVAPADKRAVTEADAGIASAVYLHFASTANQIRFVLARDALRQSGHRPADEERYREQIRTILDRELSLAIELFPLARNDSRLGFEASNHYFYLPLDLVEKAICCDYLRQKFDASQIAG